MKEGEVDGHFFLQPMQMTMKRFNFQVFFKILREDSEKSKKCFF